MKNALHITTAIVLMLCLPLFHVFQVVTVSQQRALVEELILSNSKNTKSVENLYVLKSQFPSIAKGDEIWINNNLYDVIAVEDEGQGYRLLAKADTIEQMFDSLAEKNQSQTPNKSSQKGISHLPDWSVGEKIVLSMPCLSIFQLISHTNLFIQNPFLDAVFMPPEGIAIAS